jgi:glycosyltransferase involved in cell wall biosynthesis
MQENEILNKVLYIGPSIKARGGIASVLSSYASNFPAFNYVSTNSRFGTIPGLFMLALLLVKLVGYRLFTPIKIVHIHGATGKSWYRKMLIINEARLLGFKIVWHCHASRMKEFTASYGTDKIKRTLVKCDEIVVLSKSWFDYFHETFGLTNVTIVNNIVSRPQAKLQNSSAEVRYLFLGEIGPRKGVFDIIEAVRQHKAELAGRFRLIVGGNGEVDKLTGLISQYDLGQLVEFVGWVGGEKKTRLLQQCDVLILPSYNEGLPISILEGMSYRMPIISTPVGGIPEVITTNVNGVLVTPGNCNEIFAAIMRYISDRSLIATEGQKGESMVSVYYPDAVLAQLIQVYRKCLK